MSYRDGGTATRPGSKRWAYGRLSIATDHSDHHDHPNHVAIFAGITTGGDDDNHGEEDAALTVGLDYERRLSDLLASAFLATGHLAIVANGFLRSPSFFILGNR